MAAAGDDYKSQVLAATNIVELIGQTVALKQAGKDYKGLCPFHQEKSPSFHVSPVKQFFYCYGCKEGGDAISFVMKRDRVEFKDALRSLGERAGIPMPKFAGGADASNEKRGERQAMHDANSAACAFFEKLLAHPQFGAAAREYLETRQINADSIKRFQIGLAPDGWDGLLRSAVGRKFDQQQLALAGLVKPREKGDGYYDAFRNRLMFPIRDENGRVIAFGGRKLKEEDNPKYLNSPETPLFSKGRTVFGLDLARHRIVETRTAIVVEGYTDVVVSHQYGVTNVVSVLGTAMTEQHVTTLRRFADKIVLLFDADTAGDLAVDRAVGLFLTQPVEIAIGSMPDNVDPDEFVIEHGAEGFDRIIAGAVDALAYKWKQLTRRFNESGSSLTGQQKAVEEYLKTLGEARGTGPVDSLRWGQALARISRLTEVPREELNRRFGKTKPPARSAQSPQPALPAAWRREITPEEPAERLIVGILLNQPSLWFKAQQRIGPERFVSRGWHELAEIYWNYQRDEGEPVFNEFLGLLKQRQSEKRDDSEASNDVQTPDLVELAVIAGNEADAIGNFAEALERAIDDLEELRRHRREQKLMTELRRTSEEQPADTREQAELDLLARIQEKARRPDLRRA